MMKNLARTVAAQPAPRVAPAAVIPRWACMQPAAGPATARLDVAGPAGLAGGAGRLAAGRGVPWSAVALAACAKVLSLLAGDAEVLAGYVAPDSGPGSAPVAVRLPVPPGTWADLIDQAVSQVAGLSPEVLYPPAPPAAAFETVIDLTGNVPDELADDLVLWVGLRWNARRLSLSLRYRTSVLDAASAARVAGYHLSALAAITSGDSASHGDLSLLSADELRFQDQSLAGPARPLPDCCFHELFEARVRLHPEAVAVRYRDQHLTYEALNRRANRVARALLEAGLGAEAVVAVVAERNLDWLACALGIFKAGCAYLPVEPGLPPARIAGMLGRSGCRTVLADGTASLERAIASGARARFIRADLLPGSLAETNPGVPVPPSQLAYLFFTSGSTGEPKGAMCEHAGMLNHLLAKVEDLGLEAGDIVAQTAPISFDISLWQLVAGLLAGSQTLLVEQDIIHDVPTFIESLAGREVTVAQLVPSYLELVVSELEQRPLPLPRLRRVLATGEALKKELASRWFAACPGIPLVNAYGLTETCDDTNHHQLTRPPELDRVPLGRPVRNVRVAVVDERLRPVPLGAPGEIVFSGVCVGRGYINDPERTRLAFLPDPAVPGGRRYRSGDIGRWLPDGTLEFLGRADAQVKIRGFRVELGEVENHLLRAPGVRDAAVIAAQAPAGASLIAFYAGPAPAWQVRKVIAAALPAYLMPDSLRRLDVLPVTGNGKVDRKALAVLAAGAEPDHARAGSGERPCTSAELRLAAGWAEVLGLSVERISRSDHFFNLGGTSLTAIRLAIRLDQAVSVPDVIKHPVLADLAARLDGPVLAGPVLPGDGALAR